MALAELRRLTPVFDWAVYFQRIGAIPSLDSVIVGQPEFYAELNKQLEKTSLDDWKDYLSFMLVFRSAPYLDSRTYGNYFAYTQALSGVKVPKERWKRVIDAEEQAIGEALGQLFVREYFSALAIDRGPWVTNINKPRPLGRGLLMCSCLVSITQAEAEFVQRVLAVVGDILFLRADGIHRRRQFDGQMATGFILAKDHIHHRNVTGTEIG